MGQLLLPHRAARDAHAHRCEQDQAGMEGALGRLEDLSEMPRQISGVVPSPACLFAVHYLLLAWLAACGLLTCRSRVQGEEEGSWRGSRISHKTSLCSRKLDVLSWANSTVYLKTSDRKCLCTHHHCYCTVRTNITGDSTA